MATLKQLYNITVDIFLVYFGSGNKVSDPQHYYNSLTFLSSEKKKY